MRKLEESYASIHLEAMKGSYKTDFLAEAIIIAFEEESVVFAVHNSITYTIDPENILYALPCEKITELED